MRTIHAISLVFIICIGSAGLDSKNSLSANCTYKNVGGIVTTTFQGGVDGYDGAVDSYIKESDPTSSFGNLESVKWNTDDPWGTGQNTYGLFRFDDIFGDGVGQIPLDAGIVSATFSYKESVGDKGGPMQELTIDWDETITYDTFGYYPGVQWNDRTSMLIGQAWLGTAHWTLTPREVNVRESVLRWQEDPTTNKGWIVEAYGSSSYGDIYSSEYSADPTLRPKLEVVYNISGIPVLIRKPYLQLPSTNSITIVWQTDLPSSSRVVFGDTPENLLAEYIDAQLVTEHVVTLNNLQPNTRYYYAVGTEDVLLDGGDSQTFFETVSDDSSSIQCTIWATGDAGRNNMSQLNARDAMIGMLGEETPDYMLNIGDIAYNYCSSGELNSNMFAIYEGILRHTTILPAFGNHENSNNDIDDGTGPYFDAFHIPTAGESGGVSSGTESYYSLDHNGVHCICLNSMVDVTTDSTMIEWLHDDLISANASWVLVFFHHPPYTAGFYDSDTDATSIAMRELILPILEEYGADVVLSGHSHNYERSYLVDGAYDTPTTAEGHIVDFGDGQLLGDGAYQKPVGMTPHSGTVYVVAGHGAGAGASGSHPLLGFTGVGAGSCIIQIVDNALYFYNIQSTGEISDEFVITKGTSTDLNGDGMVNIHDLLVLVSAWGDCQGCQEDLTGDGVVGIADLLLIVAAWG